MLENSVKNKRKNLYLDPNLFNSIFKSHSYLKSLSRRVPVYPSTPTFPNINLTKTIKFLPVVSNVCDKNGCNKYLRLNLKLINTNFKSNSYLTSLFCRCPVNPSNPLFPQYQYYKNNQKFTCCFKCHWKMAAIIFTSTLIPLVRDINQVLIWHHFPVVAW